METYWKLKAWVTSPPRRPPSKATIIMMWGFMLFASTFDAYRTLQFAKMAVDKNIEKHGFKDPDSRIETHESNGLMRAAMSHDLRTFLIIKVAVVPFLASLLFFLSRKRRAAWFGFTMLTFVHVGLTAWHLYGLAILDWIWENYPSLRWIIS